MYERVLKVREIAERLYSVGEYSSYADCLNDAINGEAESYEDYNNLWSAVDHMTE